MARWFLQEPRDAAHGGVSNLNYFGGFNVLVNHFKLNLTNGIILYQYSVSVSGGNQTSSSQPSAKVLLYKSNSFQKITTPILFDGRNNLYSYAPLPNELLTQFSVNNYNVTIRMKNSLPLSLISERKLSATEVEMIQFLVHEFSKADKIVIGNSFYSDTDIVSIKNNYVALKGTYQSVYYTAQGCSLCVDLILLAAGSEKSVLHLLKEIFGSLHNSTLQESEQQHLESELKGLLVTVQHRKSVEKFYRVRGLTELPCREITFPDTKTGMPWRLVDYYQQRYGHQIKYDSWPCLDLSKGKKQNFVPIELCTLYKVQKFRKEKLPRECKLELIRQSMPRAEKRKDEILNQVTALNGPCSDDVAENFGISINKEMTDVSARMLQAPVIKVGSISAQTPCSRIQQATTNMMDKSPERLLHCIDIQCWGMIDFTAHPSSNLRQQPIDRKAFIDGMVRACSHLGVTMNPVPSYEQRLDMGVLSNAELLYSELNKAEESGKRVNMKLQILFCPMSQQHSGYYMLKFIAETKLGLVTQCLLSNKVNDSKNRDMFMYTLARKVNCKLGGVNVQLAEQMPTAINKNFMLVGADVNHPANNQNPSVAALVAAMDVPGSARYIARLGAQTGGKEMIVDVGKLFQDLIHAYVETNGLKPESIIYLRDGVSDTQMEKILQDEVANIIKAISSDGYKPKMTVIVAQKRHHTRIFPKDSNTPQSLSSNLLPGTIVDTKVVKNEQEGEGGMHDFFLCSHEGVIGTSKPVHYGVLLDDHNMTSDDIQKLVYHLCFVFAQSSHPVSLATPVKYADSAAYRGRVYYDGSLAFQNLPSTSTGPIDVALPQLHVDLKDRMLFI